MTDKHKIVLSFFVGVWLLCAGACTENTIGIHKPNQLIDKKTMINLLADIHITDALAEKKSDNNELKKKQLSYKYLVQLLQNYGVTEKSYTESRAYYESFPEEYMEMYNEVSKTIKNK